MKTEMNPKPKLPKIPDAPESRAPALTAEAWPVDRPKPYAKNPRRNDAAVEKVAASIREFGWAQPIVVDGDGVIIIGHTRLKAAKKLGLKTVPVLVRADLTPEQVAALRLADNKTAELAEWDEPLLAAELDALVGAVDMEQFGFDLSATTGTEGQTDEDAVPEPPPEPVSRRGAVYALGRHRLMCGDSTSAEDVARLMGGERADIAFTSPPYGASASARLRKHYKPGEKSLKSFYIEHGDKSGEWADLIRGALANMETHSVAQFVNIQMLADNKPALLEIVAERAARLGDVLVWDKQKAAPQMQSAVLNNEFEFIFLFTENGSRSVPFADWHGTESNIVRIKPGANEFADVHKAVFPVALPDKILSIASAARSVLDPFCGTGTTIIAAEKKGIRAFGMELDPHYCDVIRKRWAEFVHGEGCDWQTLAPEVDA
jgi:site-specific DNA-methyltransferase (adenine-specific)